MHKSTGSSAEKSFKTPSLSKRAQLAGHVRTIAKDILAELIVGGIRSIFEEISIQKGFEERIWPQVKDRLEKTDLSSRAKGLSSLERCVYLVVRWRIVYLTVWMGIRYGYRKIVMNNSFALLGTDVSTANREEVGDERNPRPEEALRANIVTPPNYDTLRQGSAGIYSIVDCTYFDTIYRTHTCLI